MQIGNADDPNVVVANGGDGIRIAADAGSTWDVAVRDNAVGVMDGTRMGNGGVGIRVAPGGSITEVVLDANVVTDSGDVGILVQGGDVRMSANRVTDNALCGVRVGGRTWSPPSRRTRSPSRRARCRCGDGGFEVMLLGQVLFDWVPSTQDGDGVEDRWGCDQCPGVPGATPSADGCL